MDAEPSRPGIGVRRAPSPPAFLTLLAIEKRQAFPDVLVDLGELPSWSRW